MRKCFSLALHGTTVPPFDLATMALHVALCFFGLTRSLDWTVGNVRSSIIDPLLMADMNVSVYLHTYNRKTISNQRSAENQTAMHWTAYKLLQADRWQIDDADAVERQLIAPNMKSWLQHGDAWGESDRHVTLRNFLKQLYSLEQVTKLWSVDDGSPDIVFYLRSDLWFFNKLDTAELKQAVLQPNTLFTPSFHRWNGLNDRLAFGSAEVMQVYGNRVKHASTFSQLQALHAERFLLYSAQQAGLNVSGETKLLFERVRATGELWGVPSEHPQPGDDLSVFEFRPGLRIQQGVLGTIEIVSM